MGPDFIFNNSFDTHTGVPAVMLWVGIVQRMKRERGTLIIETLPAPLTTASPLFLKHSEDACLHAIALPQNHLNEDLKEERVMSLRK